MTKLMRLVDETELALREAQSIYADLMSDRAVTQGRLRNAANAVERLLRQVVLS